ncbi:MAG: HAD hydrolase family protein [Eubacteriales bacterium]|nr:HAD hydrolase family protein [Eubacteriales bacterium]
MKSRIFFFDVDDTLMDSETGRVPESAYDALAGLQKNGNKICIASGRKLIHPDNPKIYDDLVWDGYVCNAGQLVYNRERECIYDLPYPEEIVRKCLDVVEENHLNILIHEKNRSYIVNDNLEDAYIANRFFNMDMPPIKQYDGGSVYGMVLYMPKNYDLSIFDKILDITLYPGKSNFADVVYGDADKYKGILKILEYYHESSYIAFGDSNNDEEMMKHAEVSICLGQGTDNIKTMSSYVTDSVNNNGIWNACRMYGWI